MNNKYHLFLIESDSLYTNSFTNGGMDSYSGFFEYEKCIKYANEWIKENPELREAHIVSALKDGTLDHENIERIKFQSNYQ